MRLEPLSSSDNFSFYCGPDLECFTTCCSNLQLVLTPYDVIRLKKRLALNSSEFIDQYCELRHDTGFVFPLYFLKMDSVNQGRCYFLGKDGCTVYTDRPSACRLYPVGIGSTFLRTGSENNAFFLVKEGHCLGHKETKVWNLDSWFSHEGVLEYHSVNKKWVELVTAVDRLRVDEHWEKKIKMYLMVSYDIDRFRQFVFNTKFTKVFDLGSELEAIKNDDVQLFHLGVEWLKFALRGEQTLKVRNL